MCESCRRTGRLVPKLPPIRPFGKREIDPWQLEVESEMRRMVDRLVKYQNARLEIDIIRVLAQFPWYVHLLAKNPAVWAIFKGARAQ